MALHQSQTNKAETTSFSDKGERKILHTCKQCHNSFYASLPKKEKFSSSSSPYRRACCPFCHTWNEIILSHLTRVKQGNYSIIPFYEETGESQTIPLPDKNILEKRSIVGFQKEHWNEGNITSAHSLGQFVQKKIRKFFTNDFGEFISKEGKRIFSFFSLKKFLIIFSVSFLGIVASFFLLVASLRLIPALYLENDVNWYLRRVTNQLPNRIIDKKGNLVAELFSNKIGKLEEQDVPQMMKEIIIFAEDNNFYGHHGIYWPSVFRAFVSNIISFCYKEGGSTITQQLARLLLANREKKIWRKLQEATLAYRLEKELSKEKILTTYLNLIYLGHGNYGVENAASFYFGKKISELNFVQFLLLASMPPAPEHYSPLRHPKIIQKKMDYLVKRMQKENFPVPNFYAQEKEITFHSINRSPLANAYNDRIDYAPYVTEYIRQEIVDKLGSKYMYNSGLTIEISLDLSLQKKATQETKDFIASNAPLFAPSIWQKREGKFDQETKQEKLKKEIDDMALAILPFSGYFFPQSKKKLQVACIGIENKTGNILFLQGGSHFGVKNQFNRAIQMRRQTGSTIKPIIYALAIENNIIHAASLLDDRPIFVANHMGIGMGTRSIVSQNHWEKDYWDPVNYGGVYEGTIPVRRAIGHSKNLPAIQLGRLLGMKKLREGFRLFFFPHPEELIKRFRSDYTIAIGSLEMSPLEMALAYSALGNNGQIQRPHLILSIKNMNGDMLYEVSREKNREIKPEEEKINESYHNRLGRGLPMKRRVLSGDTAQIIVDLMRSSASSSRSGVQIKNGTKSKPLFVGKTGTSNAYRDAWFVGLTPEISAAVWVGFDNSAYSMPKGTGSRLAGPLWGRIMKKAIAKQKKDGATFQFTPNAKSVKTCPTTGRLYTSSCSKPYQKEFLRQNYPMGLLQKVRKEGL